MKRLLIVLSIFLIGSLAGCQKQNVEEAVATEELTMHVGVDTLYFDRISRTEINILWLDKQDNFVDTYTLKKRAITEAGKSGEWQIVEIIKSDGSVNGEPWKITDELVDDKPQQFEYRVDVTLDETATSETGITEIACEGTSILASNVKVCIDPGHFNIAKEVADADEYHYVEGNFVLDVALKLRDILYWEYGIDVSMTRDTDSITLEGYTDEELDSAHISLRGEYAAEEDCDLFVSLHTNSNEEDANSYPTFFQPVEVNKPIIIVNTVALTSDIAMNAANAVGENLAVTNYELGLAVSEEFKTVSEDDVPEWTQELNDGLQGVGTVVVRTGKKNPDYYGILRGATNVGIPGMIIEHGHHSVQQVRKEAVEGKLAAEWAKVDAAGIATGFGF